MVRALTRPLDVHGVRIPALVYGTAWKEERTAPLVRAALAAGFRGIDTANQRRHYHEAGVGEALQAAIREGIVGRDEVFLQTKFTYVRGQDHRLPYDPDAPVARQVERSFASSCDHLGVERVDAYLLHGPWGPTGIAPQDLEAWGAMEDLHRAGRARLLGCSNVTLAQLEALHDTATVKPAVVQNRTLTRPQADLGVRAFCRAHGLAYEGFSLLTAAPQLLAHPLVRAVATRIGATPEAAALRLFAEQGMVALTGTTSPSHMADDLAALDVALGEDEVAAFARLVGDPAAPA